MSSTTSDPVCSSSTENTPDKEKIVEECNELISKGKRDMLIDDIVSAVNSLEKASSRLATEFGEVGTECAESYFWYGKSLLELARVETGVLGNALKGTKAVNENGEDTESVTSSRDGIDAERIPDMDVLTEDDKEAIHKQVSEAIDENTKSLESEGDKKEKDTAKEIEDTEVVPVEETKEGDAETVAKEESGKEGDKEGENNGSEEEDEETEGVEDVEENGVDGNEDDKTGEETEAKKEDEDIDNLQIAWEFLDLAKIIYSRAPEATRDHLRIAEIRQKLGEVAMESGQFESARDELLVCIELRKAHNDTTRRIAEAFYHLGLSQSYGGDVIAAKTSFQQVVAAFNKSIESLDVEADKDEIESLNNLIKDVKAKIEDMEDIIKSKEALETPAFPSGGGGDTQDISHLIKKRKTTEEQCSPNKKPRVEETNGVPAIVVTNGDGVKKPAEE